MVNSQSFHSTWNHKITKKRANKESQTGKHWVMLYLKSSSRAWIYNVGSHPLSSNPNPTSSIDRNFLSPFQRASKVYTGASRKECSAILKAAGERRRKRTAKTTLLLDSLGSHPTRWPRFSSYLEAILICIFLNSHITGWARKHCLILQVLSTVFLPNITQDSPDHRESKQK